MLGVHHNVQEEKMSVKILVLVAALLSLGAEPLRADQICDPANEEAGYVKKIAADMQRFAPKVTKTGIFAFKEEYPGDGTSVWIISFSDRGNNLFMYRLKVDGATELTVEPDKSIGDGPGFMFVIRQGSLGQCRYSVSVRDAKFVVVDRGLKQSKSKR